MRTLLTLLLAINFSLSSSYVAAATAWKEGEHYFTIKPAQPRYNPSNHPIAKNSIEIVEAFSYGCPACFSSLPTLNKLKTSLPPNVHLEYLPASFIPRESWPLFQRAFYTAQALGIAEKAHDAMFAAVWETGELAVAYPNGQIKSPPPTIKQIAQFYSRVAGVKPETFLSTAQSFGVDTKMRQADKLIKAYKVDSTPMIVINGKYRLSPQSAGSYDQFIELMKWLIAQESK